MMIKFNLLMILIQTQFSAGGKKKHNYRKNTICCTDIAANMHITSAFSN